MEEYFECPECHSVIPFQFGSDREPVSHLYGKGCGSCAKGYRHAQIAESRRRRQHDKLWGNVVARPCVDCGEDFTPTTGAGKQSTMIRCNECRKPKIRHCSCGADLLTRKRSCDDCREMSAALTDQESKSKVEARMVVCPFCDVTYDSRHNSNRKFESEACGDCYSAVRYKIDRRLRDFRTQMFTSLFSGFDGENVDAIIEMLEGSCHYCDETDNLTIEHLTPLIRGGDHCIKNIVAACHSCNSQKNKMTEEEYDEWLHQNPDKDRRSV